MRYWQRRLAMASAVLAGGGLMLAGPNTGCVRFLAESAVTATDFCFIFDCQNGILGGTIDPCSGRRDPGTGGGGTVLDGPFFADCPDTGP